MKRIGLIAILFLLIIPICAEGGMTLGTGAALSFTEVSWVSPTGFTAGDWSNEANAYDGDAGTYASTGTHDQEMELTIASTSCSKVRIKAANSVGGDVSSGKIEVYYGGAYHELHDGVIATGDWVEYEIGSQQDVTKARLTLTDFTTFRCYEFEFGSVTATGAGIALE